MTTPPLQLGPREWVLIALQSMLWGSAFFFIAVAGREMGVFTITMLRLLPALALVGSVLYALGLRIPATLGEWRVFLAFSTLNSFIPFVLTVYGQREVSGGMAAVLNTTAPLIAMCLAHVLTVDEKFSSRKVAGLLVGMAGVALVVGLPGLIGGSAAAAGFGGGSTAARHAPTLLSQLAIVAAAACYAVANVFGRRAFAAYHPFVIAFGQMLGSLVIAVPFALVIDQPWRAGAPSGQALAAVLAMGVLGSGLSSLCHFTVLKRAGVVNAMLAPIIMPLTPITLGWLFLDERLTVRELVGAGVIALALVIIDGRLLRRLGR